ncbi:MAG: aminotransferase class IV [Syntrophomonadaceae bacterium]|nr:aminotransferase class IV [Syntrophomonadaceae bacterium]
MSTFAWVKGQLVDETAFCLKINDRGLLYGDGLFETIRVYQGRPFSRRQHCARLADGCKALKITYPEPEIEIGTAAVLKENRLVEGSLKIIITRGESSKGLLDSQILKPSVVITAKAGTPYSALLYKRGFRAVTVSFPRNHLSPLARLKSLNYLENILGRREASAAGADEGVFLNLLGEVTEGTASNIFFVFNESIVTPPQESGLLPGITRATVISLARQLGIPCIEKTVLPSDFKRAEEIFLTSSLLEIMPLVILDGHPVSKGQPGPITEILRKAYRKHVQQNLEPLATFY